MAVYARAAQHHSALVLHIPKQSLVKTIGFAALRTISEGDDRQVGRRAWIEPVDLLQAGMKIACKRQLFGLCRPESDTSGILKGSPKRQPRKLPFRSGDRAAGQGTHLESPNGEDILGTRLDAMGRVGP